jgi:hypothetical protein
VVTRRSVLKWATVGAAAIGLRPLIRERAASASTLPRPRFYLQIIPSGGMDPVYGADPRTPSKVQKGIDVPYKPRDIIDLKNTRIGPSFGLLAPHMDRIAIINGVRQNSANHHSGLLHVTCLRSTSVPGTPTMFELLGSRRTHEATGAVSMGFSWATPFSPKFLGVPAEDHFGKPPGIFDHLDKLDGDDLRVAARALRREAATLKSQLPKESSTTANLEESAALFEGWAKAPKFNAANWNIPLEDHMGSAATDLQRSLWMFENNLTRCATVSFGMYDSHFRNHYTQSRKIPYLAQLIGTLLKELDRRIVDGKPLSEQTVVIVGSEMGRFPRLNSAGGKDHFSQGSWLVIGPWFATGLTHGATNDELLSVPVSMASGKADKAGHLLTVDDLGTTLMTLDGANPSVYGYGGEHMSFVMR